MFSNFGLLDFSTPELIIILAIILLLFGGRKLPELSKSLSDSIRELRKGISSADENKNKTNNKSNNDNQTKDENGPDQSNS